MQRKTMLVWPPIGKDDEQGWPACLAQLAWFAGHLADEIILPVEDPTLLNKPMPSYPSAASLQDAQRVRVVPASGTDVTKGVQLVLVRSRDVTARPPPLPLRRMRGSEAVHGISLPSDAREGPAYYYIGKPDQERQDAYYAVCLTYWLLGGEDKSFLERSRNRLVELRSAVKHCPSVNVFGTGPSLIEALDKEHSGSCNIICNSIVKNRAWLSRLRPRMIVASDAHFHFSFHRYSSRFLSDLIYILETQDACFFTFDKFATFARHRIPELADRVFGIPAGRVSYGFDLDKDFRVYPGESVVNMFLLPVASFLGDSIALHGFTGRSPTDKYFWAHSDLHQYADLMEDVRLAHPAFFSNRDYPGYAEQVDKSIAERVVAARHAGKRVGSATTSFYSAFLQ